MGLSAISAKIINQSNSICLDELDDFCLMVTFDRLRLGDLSKLFAMNPRSHWHYKIIIIDKQQDKNKIPK